MATKRCLEDTSRLHYESSELKLFEHIECEWPLFFTYLLLDAYYRGDGDRAAEYRSRLEKLEQRRGDIGLLPELYYVPAESIEAERKNPGSQIRLPNENVPLVWAQSLWWLAQMLQDGLLDRSDMDPLGRHRRRLKPPPLSKLPSWRRISKLKLNWLIWESALIEWINWNPLSCGMLGSWRAFMAPRVLARS